MAERAHAPAFKEAEGWSIVAAADAAEPRRAAAQAAFPGIKAYSTGEEMLVREKLDFVVICTPPSTHGPVAFRCLERGLHVLCEKPLTLDPIDLAALEKAAQDADRALVTVHNWAHAPIWAKALELVAAGRLGKVLRAELQVLRREPAASAVPGDWRRDPKLAGGGILVDHGWHALYLIRRMMDGPAEAKHIGLTRGPSGADEEATLLLRFPEAEASLHLSWRAPLRWNWALVRGEKAALELRDDELVLSERDGSSQRWTFPQKLSQGSAHPEWMAAFLPSVRDEFEGKTRGRSLAEARFCCETISACYATEVAA